MSYGVGHMLTHPEWGVVLSEKTMTDHGIGGSKDLSRLQEKMLLAKMWTEPREKNMKGRSEL